MMDPIVKRIEELFLTRSEARIADFIIDNLDTIGLMTSRELAKAVNVSDTSVIRFVHKLGFPTYARFRAEMNSRICRHFSAAGLDGTEAEEDTPQPVSQTQAHVVSGTIMDNLQRTFHRLEDGTIRQIVDILLRSEHKYIAGFHTTACCAEYMATRLVKLLPHVIPVVNADASSVEAMLDISPADCLMVYSFLHYSKINAPLMNLARQKGAKIILVTDKATSPLVRKADIVLLTPIDTGEGAYSYVAPLSVSEIILMMLIAQSGSDGEARMRWLEDLLEHAELY